MLNSNLNLSTLPESTFTRYKNLLFFIVLLTGSIPTKDSGSFLSLYDMYDMFEKKSLCRNHHRPVDLFPYKPEADHLHDDRCNPGYRIRQKQESQ